MSDLDFSEFFQPVDIVKIAGGRNFLSTQFGALLRTHTAETGWPEMEGVQLVLIGVNEDRRSMHNHGCAIAPDHVRENLYRLFQGEWALGMADLGDIRAGATPADVVKCSVFLADRNDFSAMNEVYAEFFGDAKPARTTVEVVLPMEGMKVEIDCVAYKPK